MNKTRLTKREAAGWAVGDAKDFLGLSPEQAAFVEFKLALSQALRARREAHHLSQAVHLPAAPTANRASTMRVLSTAAQLVVRPWSLVIELCEDGAGTRDSIESLGDHCRILMSRLAAAPPDLLGRLRS